MEWLKTETSRDVIQHLQNVYRSVTDILYPHRCPVCECIVDKQGEICRECVYKVKYITEPFCMVCGKPLEQEERELCGDCTRKKHNFVRGVAAFAYTKEIKQSIYRFKYSNRREYSAFYGDMILKLKGQIIRSWQPDVIIPVPLHPARLRKRGFNQAELVAKRLGDGLGVPVDTKILVRTVNTAPQKSLDDKERARNIKRAFQLTENIVKYKKALLVDDIYTTGATLDSCADVLLQAGVMKVYFAAVCTGRGF